MVDFAVFDYLLDSVFIVDGDGKVVYCNEMAATFCQSSVRRMAGKVKLMDVINFDESGLLPFDENSHGRTSPSPLIETAYTLVKAGRTGKTQLTVRPMGDGKHWVFFLHDVSLEETLAAKYKAELQKTEEYARNLEKLVEERTVELRKVNQTLNAILESLGQGFFTFSADGTCGAVFTKACRDILEKLPSGKSAIEVLGIPEAEKTQFQKWTESLFKEFLPFDDLKVLGPNLYPHSQGRYIVLDYFPIRREEGEISDVVVVATDKTTEREAQLALESEKQYAAMIVKYMKNKNQFHQFLFSVRQSCKQLLEMAAKPLNGEQVNEAFRVLHTLEGEAGTFSMGELRNMARESQHILEPYKKGGEMPSSVHLEFRNSLIKLRDSFEKFLEDNKEIIRLPNAEASRTIEATADGVRLFLTEVSRLSGGDVVAQKGRDLFFKEPIENRIKYFDSLSQSVAERLNKKLKPMIIEGGEVRIDPEPYQKVFSAMVHAFRNAVDHGLEAPEEREFAGKEPAGQIKVRIEERNDGIHLSIEDDGKGIDPAVIREKLKSRFPENDFSKESDEEIIQHVCMPGFSSRDQVGEFSGRGVGLDALREEILKIGGTIHIESKINEGTQIGIFLPAVSPSGQLNQPSRAAS